MIQLDCGICRPIGSALHVREPGMLRHFAADTDLQISTSQHSFFLLCSRSDILGCHGLVKMYRKLVLAREAIPKAYKAANGLGMDVFILPFPARCLAPANIINTQTHISCFI